MTQLSAKPALLAAAFFALSCAECDGRVESAHQKASRTAHSTTAFGPPQQKMHRVASVGSPKNQRRLASGGKSSRRQFAMKQNRNTRSQSRQVAHGKSHGPWHDKHSNRNIAMLGLASFYSEDCETASGETFDKNKLNAAHPSLPFGTRLRVTNVANGRSVTVRVNDRGPFVSGRIIDLTSAAAQVIGMIDAGVVNVTLRIVR